MNASIHTHTCAIISSRGKYFYCRCLLREREGEVRHGREYDTLFRTQSV